MVAFKSAIVDQGKALIPIKLEEQSMQLMYVMENRRAEPEVTENGFSTLLVVVTSCSGGALVADASRLRPQLSSR